MNRYKAKAVADDIQKKIKIVLKAWVQCPIEEDGSIFAFCWRFKQSRIGIYLYWGDAQEGIRVTLHSPLSTHDREWREVSGRVVDPVVDAVASYATVAINEKQK